MYGFSIPLLPPQAAEFAVTYDLLFWYITAVITAGSEHDLPPVPYISQINFYITRLSFLSRIQ